MGPTRWGNQLNGNKQINVSIGYLRKEAPLAGAIS